MVDGTMEPAWAKRIEDDVGRIANRVDRIDGRLSAIEDDGLEGRVSRLERTVAEMKPTLDKVALSVLSTEKAVKIGAGGLGLILIVLQIISMIP